MLQTVLLVLSLATAQSAPGSLHIVVVEGEAGVNIIQQKTAVKPLIEVRDRNNQPIAGVVVTFSIEGGKAATFGGASSLTVATNAAGQAAVSSLTPNVAGAFQIQVSAAFQGQVATATIAQTNVLTAAQAAAASAATGTSGTAGGGGAGGASGAGGAAGGAGGGLSVTTIAVAGAAVAGGAVAAVEVKNKVSGEGGEKYTGTFSGTINGTVTGSRNCTYTRTVSGANAKVGLKDHSDTAVRGQFEYEGGSVVTATTCVPGVPDAPQFTGSVDELTGSPSSFTGRQVYPAPPAPGITGEHVYTFTGSLNGNTITGTFKYEETTQTSQPTINETMQGVGTFTITFQKQ